MATPSSASSIRAKQREQIFRMLNLNQDVTVPSTGASRKAAAANLGSEEWSDSWKVLVYDRFCAEVISPLLSVKALRTKGVTLHLLIDAQRDRIADVPAVYFVQPTESNILRIAQDCADNVYDETHVNFVSSLPRPLLELLARRVVETDSLRRISKVHQQHLNFVSLEHHLFSLNMKDSFRLMHDPTVPDTKIEEAMLSIAQALLAVCVCLGCVPVIRFRKGGPGEMIGRHLNTLLREQLSGQNVWVTNAFRNGMFQRPLLLLADRAIDLATAVGHTSTYQALVDDMLGVKGNRVVVQVEEEGRTKSTKYDLDSDADAFWRTHRGSPFPEAISANGEELAQVSAKEEEVRKKTGESAEDAEAEAALIASGLGGALADAVDSLPALMNRKRMLGLHTNILRAVMAQVAARHVPTYYELEKQIVARTADKAAVFELLTNTEQGELKDKLRLAQVYLLHCPTESADAECKAAQEAITSLASGEGASEADASAAREAAASLEWLAKYLRSMRAISSVTAPAVARARAAGGPASGGGSDKWAAGLNFFSGVAEKAAGHAVGFINKAVANVKSFLPSHDQLPVTRLIAAELSGSLHAEAEAYVTLDPKISGSAVTGTGAGAGAGAGVGAGAGAAGGSAGYKRAIVFMVGGGNYTEYHNVQDFAQKPTSPRDIIYGCTELLSPDAFQAQLAALARTASR